MVQALICVLTFLGSSRGKCLHAGVTALGSPLLTVSAPQFLTAWQLSKPSYRCLFSISLLHWLFSAGWRTLPKWRPWWTSESSEVWVPNTPPPFKNGVTLAKLFNLSEPIISLKEGVNTCSAGLLAGLEITHGIYFRLSNIWQGPETLSSAVVDILSESAQLLVLRMGICESCSREVQEASKEGHYEW